MAVPSQLTVWRELGELRRAQRRAPSPRVVAASLLSINTVAATREAHGGGDVIELVDVHQLAWLAGTFGEMTIVDCHREVAGRTEVAGIRR